MEQGCPHRSILPHIFPDCNSFAIKIGGKFCGVRGVCPGGGLAPALPARRASAIPGGGRRGGSRPPTLPLVLLLPPSPRPALAERSSRQEGGDYRLFYARGCAPCIPGAEPARHWFALPLWKTQWGLASALPARRASAVPGGGRARFAACLPCHCGTRRRACPLCRLPALPLRYPAEGLPALSPVNPAFNLLPCPPSPEGKDRPPPPFPGGEWGDFLLSYARGCAPCIPGAEPGRHWLCLWETDSLGFVVAPAPAGATGTRVVKTNCPRGTCMAETVSAASGLMPGCRGRQPPAK